MARLGKIALASLLVGLASVFAQTDPLAGGAFVEYGASHDLLASDLMGTDLYVSPTPVTLARVDELPPEWELVASIGDLVIDSDGVVRGVLADIGGFLGIIGTRTVAIPIEQLVIHRSTDLSEVRVYLAITEEELLSLPPRDD